MTQTRDQAHARSWKCIRHPLHSCGEEVAGKILATLAAIGTWYFAVKVMARGGFTLSEVILVLAITAAILMIAALVDLFTRR